MIDFFRLIFVKKRSLIRLLFFLLADVILIFLSVILAFILRFEGQIPERYYFNILGIVLFSWLITLPVFYFFKLYHFTWQYVSTQELVQLIKGTSLSFLLLTGLFFVFRDSFLFSGFPRSTLFITYFFIFILSGSLRFAKRIYLQTLFSLRKGEKQKTLIVGAGDAGEMIMRNILTTRGNFFDVVGFVDDSESRQGVLIHGKKVLGRIRDIPDIVKNKKVESMIIAMPSVDSRIIRLTVEKAREAGLRKIKIIPPIEEVFSGKVTIGQLKNVEMKDLLGRSVISLNKKSIEKFIKNKSVLITGAAGSIGSELCRQIANFNPSLLILIDQDETGIFNISEEIEDNFPKLKKVIKICDITNKYKIERIFNELKPQIVFHAAAYKHVPLMEENPDEAVRNNVFGTKNVAEFSLLYNVEKFIFISTDKAVNPVSVMGITKRIGEMICQFFNNKSKTTKFIAVRFGNVLDSRGSVIPIFREKIKKREPIEITHPEMKRYFMITSEACLLVLQAAVIGEGGGVFVLDMGSPIKIVELAEEMIRLCGLEPDKDIPIVFTQPRSGEKIFEEILTDKENAVATQNNRIFIAKLPDIDYIKLDKDIKKLEEELNLGEENRIKKLLKEIIKE